MRAARAESSTRTRPPRDEAWQNGCRPRARTRAPSRRILAMTHRLWIGAARFLAVVALAHAGMLAAQGSCPSAWLPTFGARPGTNSDVWAIVGFDDGSGPALYVGGQFTAASSIPANRIAKWNGASWSALGTGVDAEVDALAVFDDG